MRRHLQGLRVGGMLASAVIVSVLLAAPNAEADSTSLPSSGGPGKVEPIRDLIKELGEDRTAGLYFDAAKGDLVVAVTDADAKAAVEQAGVEAKMVEHDTADLQVIIDKLNASFEVPGTSWGLDEENNQVFVNADSTVSAQDYAALADAIAPYGDAARIERTTGKAKTSMSVNGGDSIHDSAITCTYGFSVQSKSDSSKKSFLTAGHCTQHSIDAGSRAWYAANNVRLGYVSGHFFPGNDFGLVDADPSQAVTFYGNVNTGGGVQDIAHAMDPVYADNACTYGQTSGPGCGTIIGTNVTVNYADGKVTGLAKTNICRNYGDSGGPPYLADYALGLQSGIDTNDDGSVHHPCASYYQPVKEALAWYNVEVY